MRGQGRYGERGFTLVELTLVIAIIGLLSAMAILYFRQSHASQETDRAAWELASDIRWMQQLSTNDGATRSRAGSAYRYHLEVWGANYTGTETGKSNTYDLLDMGTDLNSKTILKGPLKFGDYHVKVSIEEPSGTSVDITYYSFDLDLSSGKALANSQYQIKLTHNDIATETRFVNIDSRTGRVWITRTKPSKLF